MKRSLILTALSFLVLAQLGLAQVPQTFSYQGVLRDIDGNLLDGNYDLTFNLYDFETVVWSEGVKLVPVSKGVFSVVLGKATATPPSPLPDPFPSPAWLGIVGPDGVEMSPRIELTAVPYSLQAGSLVLPTTTRYYSISPVAFNPKYNGSSIERTDLTLFSTAAGNAEFYAPVNLPHGAVIKEMVVAFIDNDATYNITFDLRRISLNSTGSDIIARHTSSNLSTAIQTGTESATTTVATVDNSSYTYAINTYWFTPPTVTDISVRGVKIVYEVTSPLP